MERVYVGARVWGCVAVCACVFRLFVFLGVFLPLDVLRLAGRVLFILFFPRELKMSTLGMTFSQKKHRKEMEVAVPEIGICYWRYWKVWSLLSTYLKTSSSEFFGVFYIVMSIQNLTQACAYEL